MKIGIIIGRFQPFHKGHEALVNAALSDSDEVLIFVGSANKSTTPKNPFTYEQRKEMITRSIKKGMNRVTIMPSLDFDYDNTRWDEHHADVIRSTCKNLSMGLPYEGYIYTTTKHGDVSARSNLGFDLVKVPNSGCDATTIRKILFDSATVTDNVMLALEKRVPEPVHDILRRYMITNAHNEIFNEIAAQKAEIDAWGNTPFPVQCITTDAAVFTTPDINVIDLNDLEVLLIKRKGPIGKGKWALAGGYKEIDLDPWANTLKELEEEACITEDDLGDYKVTRERVFSANGVRSKNTTIAYGILTTCRIEPVAGDDAEDAAWFQYKNLDPRMIFSDHYAIMEKMLEDLKLTRGN